MGDDDEVGQCSRCGTMCEEVIGGNSLGEEVIGGNSLGDDEQFSLCRACEAKLEALHGDKDYGLEPYWDRFTDGDSGYVEALRSEFRSWLKSGKVDIVV